MTKTLTLLLLGVLVAYGLFEAYPLLSGPGLVVLTPTDGVTVPDGVVTISGTAERASALTLNGAPLLPDKDGMFETTLAYPSGGTILTFVVTDRFGRTLTITRTVFVP